ncbi:hypothetical protein FOPG_04658 [Fusarium oxysporum f. sp. conglutinans race 2 54008]|uniref:Uncharacterized protein n=1 Tax=Fusarium oxysporum f. sp. conglutinans race 2 54008 TaxID=1089457 RepID=X0IEB7_FUSOX|nr:hypothetical protein FOPG_04658 [Fusarium oxysporum f. sp. conglutinans race 2 54008]
MSPDSEVWAYLAIKDLAEGISSAAGQDDSQSCMLDKVESWTRGEGAPVISDSTAGDWGIRVTKDRCGIRKTERLVGLPSYALIPPDQARTSGVDFRIGAARIKLSGNGKSVMWDTPNPPRSGRLSFIAPCDNERLCDMRLRTLDLRSTRGLTFFYVGSSLRAIHSHTSRFPTALTTYARLLEHARKHAVWAHVPISPNDRLIGSGIRTSGMDNVFTSPSVLVRTKLAGDIVIGPQFRPFTLTSPSSLIRITPVILYQFLIYDIPATEDEQMLLVVAARSSKPNAHSIRRFPPTTSSTITHSCRCTLLQTQLPLQGTIRIDIFTCKTTGLCRGMLFEYDDGAQRAVGQCRIGIDH